MKRILIAGAAAAMIWSADAAELTVDTSSDEAMKASIMAMVDALPSDQRPAFGQALLTLGLSNIILSTRPEGDGLNNLPANEADSVATLRSLVGGKTAAEIIALADEKVPPLKP